MEENQLIENYEDIAFPIKNIPSFSQPKKIAENPIVIKKIIRGAIQGAYQKKTPSSYECKYNRDQMPYVSEEEVQFVIHLIESLQPADAIEAALASQFVITYIYGLNTSSSHISRSIEMFEFGHQVLETLTKYRTKGAQQIQVNYNHNQGQITNIKMVEPENKQETIEVRNEL